MLEAPPLTRASAEIEKTFQTLVNDVFPKGTFFQCLLLGSHKIEPILNAFEKARSHNALSFTLSKRRTDFIRTQMTENKFTFRHFRLFFVVSISKKKINLADFLLLRIQMQTALNSIVVKTENVSVHHFLSLWVCP